MVTLVDAKSEGTKATVIVEGANFSEVTSLDARKMAIDEGTRLLGLCGIGGSTGPFPVKEDGTEIIDGEQLAKVATEKATIRYRNEFLINQSMSR